MVPTILLMDTWTGTSKEPKIKSLISTSDTTTHTSCVLSSVSVIKLMCNK